jgi:large subunit ribosomal protein L13
VDTLRHLSYKTRFANAATVKREWYIVDAQGQTLGRICSRIASVLRGKHKPDYTPHFDAGDHVIVINADKVRLTGKKMTDKVYLSYSLYPGGQKATTPEALLASKPEQVIEKAVKGMLPKNTLGRAMYRKLFVYAGPDHKHQAQQPKPLPLI